NTLSYHYDRQTWTGGQLNCDPYRYGSGTADRDAWPTTISWGANLRTGAPDRYQVTFDSTSRATDTQFDGADNQYAGTNGQPRETRVLNAIRVQSNTSNPYQANAWQLIRQYNLGHAITLTSD